jgi:hypothetical protein
MPLAVQRCNEGKSVVLHDASNMQFIVPHISRSPDVYEIRKSNSVFEPDSVSNTLQESFFSILYSHWQASEAISVVDKEMFFT